ncbi:MAG TPA: hypothetical protein VF785_10985 [Gemmatimonadaceae bacterium]
MSALIRQTSARAFSAAWLALIFGLVAGSPATAQNQPPPSAEYLADAVVGRGTAVQVGAGASVPLGIYVRLGIDAAGGATWRDQTTRASGRVDVIGRFLLDPFRETPLGLSFGGGISVPYTDGDGPTRPYLTVVIDVEGRMHGPVTPALRVGLGGGARIGVVLRTTPARWR